MMYVGPRYIICGDQIFYYAEAIKADPIDHALHEGVYKVMGERGKVLRIERSKFPTNARKEHKIKAHQQMKFEKIIRRVHLACVRAKGGDSVKELMQPGPKKVKGVVK